MRTKFEIVPLRPPLVISKKGTDARAVQKEGTMAYADAQIDSPRRVERCDITFDTPTIE